MSRESRLPPSLRAERANDPSARQRTASDPAVSSWAAASAGSGKTKVLTDRMLRLLLPREDGQPGTDPKKILALTFTKAGANEMAMRLSERLSHWAVMTDEKLSLDIDNKLLGRPPTETEIAAARTLFARVVDTPGGLNIMTIHSFCQSVLGRFPIEAGIPPNFRPLEEEQAAEYVSESMRFVLGKTRMSAGSPLENAIVNLVRTLGEQDIPSLIKNVIRERKQFQDVLSRTFGVEGFYTQLCTAMDVPTGLTDEQAFARFAAEGDEAALRSVCPALAASKSTGDQAKANAIQAYWDEIADNRMHAFEDYAAQIVRKNGNFWEPTQDAQKKDPAVLGILQNEYERIQRYMILQKKKACADLTRDLFLLADAVLSDYQRRKEKTGALDFDDLIIKTLSLLKGDIKSMKGLDVAPWVLYKLDEGLDHILVDEAQDTNPEQWDIVDLLSADFFTGMGARDFVRTIFVVGDEKQSIFGFQRAAPDKMTDMRARFARRIREAEQVFAPVDINTSFRSVQTVLDAVDTVFSYAEAVQGLGPNYLPHTAFREGQAGLVEVWPICRTQSADADNDETEEGEQAGGWDIPDRVSEVQSGSAQMAAKIAQTIRGWLDNEEPLESYGRAIRPGDIMVLVRSRNAFVPQLVRALKRNRVPVSGVDRMILSDQLAVQDMVAAARFALLPDDDLTLACLLKSPFIGMDEDVLYEISYGRNESLWNILKKKGDAKIISWLEALIAKASGYGPYAFLSSLVQEPCPANSASGMRAIHARLGDDSIDPVDEVLNAALAFESTHTPSLQSFLHRHEQGGGDIKRQLDKGAGEVRIMTVHGSKGLQAPIVFLPDTVRTRKSNDRSDRLLWGHKTGAELPIFAPGGGAVPDDLAPLLAEVDLKADEEYRRLLYVAMTRAEERLYIGGFTGRKAPKEGGKIAYWYKDIRTALERHPDIENLPSGTTDDSGADIPILRLSHKATAAADKKEQKAEPRKDKSDWQSRAAEAPDWITKPAPAEPVPPRPLVPSRPSGEGEPAAISPLGESHAERFKRGNIIHKLMQILPDLPETRREGATRAYLARPGHMLSKEQQETTLVEVMAVLNDPAFKDIFGPRSMAEVPITGWIEDGGRLISGQIDRVLIGEHEILIVDYKTNRPPPQSREDVPEIYVAQMKAYADTLARIYPDKKIRAALLWTDNAQLMDIIA